MRIKSDWASLHGRDFRVLVGEDTHKGCVFQSVLLCDLESLESYVIHTGYVDLENRDES